LIIEKEKLPSTKKLCAIALFIFLKAKATAHSKTLPAIFLDNVDYK